FPLLSRLGAEFENQHMAGTVRREIIERLVDHPLDLDVDRPRDGEWNRNHITFAARFFRLRSVLSGCESRPPQARSQPHQHAEHEGGNPSVQAKSLSHTSRRSLAPIRKC